MGVSAGGTSGSSYSITLLSKHTLTTLASLSLSQKTHKPHTFQTLFKLLLVPFDSEGKMTETPTHSIFYLLFASSARAGAGI